MNIEFDAAFVKDLKRLRGDPTAARIRIASHRLGVRLNGDAVRFVRCLHRREIYRYFP